MDHPRTVCLLDMSVSEFLEFLSVEKGASGNTISAYRNDLSQLEAYFAAGNGSTVRWSGLNQAALLDYIIEIKSKKYADSTVARKVADEGRRMKDESSSPTLVVGRWSLVVRRRRTNR